MGTRRGGRRPAGKLLLHPSLTSTRQTELHRQATCLNSGVPHFYPKHLPDFPYVGKLSYALEFTTENRALLLKEDAAIDLVVQQFLRAATETGFAIGRRVDADVGVFRESANLTIETAHDHNWS